MTALPEDKELAVTVLDVEKAYQGFRSVEILRYREDETGIEATRELATTRDAVAVVLYDTQLEKLVMIRQFRLGAHLGVGKGFGVEIVAGLIDEGEEPAESAAREVTEETGLTANKLVPLCKFLTTPGITDEVIHLFYAEVDASNLTDRAGAVDENEQTFPFTVSLESGLSAVLQNTVYNGIVMIGLLTFAQRFSELVENT